jgi:hypothetical protein
MTSLLIVNGALLAVTKIIEPTFGLNLYLAIALPYVFLADHNWFHPIGLGLMEIEMKQ